MITPNTNQVGITSPLIRFNLHVRSLVQPEGRIDITRALVLKILARNVKIEAVVRTHRINLGKAEKRKVNKARGSGLQNGDQEVDLTIVTVKVAVIHLGTIKVDVNVEIKEADLQAMKLSWSVRNRRLFSVV